jgi:RNA polymerase sigma factor (sigma-70 family)
MSDERRRLLTAARRLLPSRADAEDAVQDSYVRALVVLNGAAPEPAWMYTVLRNIAIDRLRRQHLEAKHGETELPQERSSEDRLRLRAECEAALRHLLGRTSLAEAAAILLRDVFEFEYAEIARLIGKSETTCRQFLQRARTRTRRSEPSSDTEEMHVRCCWQAIEARDPTPLVDMIRMPTACKAAPARISRQQGALRSYSQLVQVNGRYALALVLNGAVLCVVPVGTQISAEDAAVETC